METENLNIVMLLFQPSVVARGLEKKLIELGNTVNTIIGEFYKIDECLEETQLFIINLPNKIADDTKEIKTLINIFTKLNENGKKLIVVGEKELWDELARVYKGIVKYVWVYRPVEMDALSDAIEKAMTSPVYSPSAEGLESADSFMAPSKPRILIVDDDPAYAKMVREWIKDTYRVDIVTAGMQAITFLLKAAENDKVDLILLDYEMPVVDGPQVLQMLRQEPVTAGIPVIFLTGVGSREGVARVMELKPAGYILKTTTRDNLLSILAEKIHA